MFNHQFFFAIYKDGNYLKKKKIEEKSIQFRNINHFNLRIGR